MNYETKVQVSSAEMLYARRFELAERVVDAQWQADPSLEERWGDEGRAKCEQDTRYHILYLSEAVRNGSYVLFREYLAWAKTLLSGLGIGSTEVLENLSRIREAVVATLPSDRSGPVLVVLDRGIADYPRLPSDAPTYLDAGAPSHDLAAAYLQDLLDGRRQVASRRILDAVDGGVPIKDVYLHVFQPVQREVGRLWQMNELTVAQEHYCTAATQMIMCQLYPRLFDQPKSGLTFVGSCVSGELHEIGVRMITDFFELEGWDTYFLGANTPANQFVSTLVERHADVLGISATIGYHVRLVAEIIDVVRADARLEDVRILVGGYPFNQDPELWKRVGADGFGRDAEDAVRTALQLVS